MNQSPEVRPADRPSRFRIIVFLALTLFGIFLLLPKQAPAAPLAPATLLYTFHNQKVSAYDVRTGAYVRTIFEAEVVQRAPNGVPIEWAENLVSIIADSHGYLYVATAKYRYGNHDVRILRFDAHTGDFIDTFIQNNQIRIPLSLAIKDDYLYILADHNSDMSINFDTSVLRYRLSDGAFIDTVVDKSMFSPYPPPGVPPYLSAEQMAIGVDGDIYIFSNNYAYLIRINGTTGEFVSIFNENIKEFAALNPRFALGPDGSIYMGSTVYEAIQDRTNHKIQHFNPQGELIGTINYLPDFTDIVIGPDGLLYVQYYSFESEGQQISTFDPISYEEYSTIRISEYGTSERNRFAVVGPAAAQEIEEIKPADVAVAQVSSPVAAVGRTETLTVTLTVTNRGEGSAANATITLPLDPARVSVIDAQTSREEAWVSAAEADSLTFQTGRLASTLDTVTVTLRLRVQADAPDGLVLPERPTLRWTDAGRGGTRAGNLLPVQVAADEDTRATLTLQIDPVQAAAGTTRTIQAAWFIPGEPVALWYHTPDETAVALGRTTASADGTITSQLVTDGFVVGRYQLVAQGVWSGITQTGVVEVQ